MDVDKNLSPKQFLTTIAAGALAVIVITILVHISLDIYGLFRPVKGREIPVYYNERTSKFLLSHRYIPQNFNTLIIGTSLSANLDVSRFNHNGEGIRIYNASLMGANIAELKPITENAIRDGHIKTVILCISPYLTKDYGSKEVAFGPKLYLGALGSRNLYETYAVAALRQLDGMKDRFSLYQIDAYGTNHYTDFFKVNNVKEIIDKVIAHHRGEQIDVHPTALQEFKALIKLLEEKNVRYFGYFHPMPAEIFDSNKKNNENFQKMIAGIIGSEDKLIDFNSADFRHFTADYSNYIDNGHLSTKGQEIITDILYKKVQKVSP